MKRSQFSKEVIFKFWVKLIKDVSKIRNILFFGRNFLTLFIADGLLKPLLNQ